MPDTRSRRLRFVVIAAAAAAATLLLAPQALVAQARDASDPDRNEVAAYRLSLETLRKVDRATLALREELRRDPRMKARMDLDAEIAATERNLDELSSKEEELTDAEEQRLDAGEQRLEELHQKREGISGDGLDMQNARTLSEMEGQVKAFAPLANALRKEGVSPRDYAKFMIALMQASMVHGAQRSGQGPKEVPPEVNLENVKWVAQNEKELERMRDAMSAQR